MSSEEESLEIIDSSPEPLRDDSRKFPKSRYSGLSKQGLTSHLMSLKRSNLKHTTVPESDDDDDDDDDEVVLSNSSPEKNENSSISKFKPVFHSSDFEVSRGSISPQSCIKSKKSFIRSVLPSSNSCKEGNIAADKVLNTSAIDPSTPEGKWRLSTKEALSDDESPIRIPTRKERPHLCIDSDSDEEDSCKINTDSDSEVTSSPEVATKKTSVSSKISCQNNSLVISDTESTSLPEGNETSQNLSTNYIEVVDSPISESKTEGKRSDLYAGKYKIKPRSIETKKSSNLNNSNLSDTSQSSLANISAASFSSTRSSLNLSNMSQAEIENTLKTNKLILKTANLNALPDKGIKIQERIGNLEDALAQLQFETKDKDTSGCSISSISDGSAGTSKARYNTSKNSSLSELEVIHEDKRNSFSDNLAHLKENLREKQSFFKSSNLRSFPDGGRKLRQSIADLEKEIMMAELKVDFDSKAKPRLHSDVDIIEEKTSTQYQKTESLPSGFNFSALAQALPVQKHQKIPQHIITSLYNVNRDYGAKEYGGKLSEMRERNMIRMTSDTVESLHQTLKTMPDVETAEETEPESLKVTLMPHQRKALRWLLWRESQFPPGGILADDMGLGKTLTMLALILRHKELVKSGQIHDDFTESKSEEGSDEEWISTESDKKQFSSKLIPSKGSLIVCPATLLGQWEGEAKKHVKSRHLSCLLYHGNSRDISLKRLSQYDLVVTTYQLVMREAFSRGVAKTHKKSMDAVPEIEAHDQGPLFRIGWARIILDEAHQIRNHKSKTSQSACMLRGGRRWVVTGTPIQNHEMDFFSLIRFLRVSPFDDYTCWKHQLKNSTAHGLQKLNLLVRALLLRRTKGQIDQVTGETIIQLPPKVVIQHKCSLGQGEREVYDRVFAFSRSSLIEYMKSQEEKEREKAERMGQTFKPQHAFINKGDKYTPTLQTDILKANELKAHHMLVLLLRLRQICGHPALIRSIIDDEVKATDGLSPAASAGDEFETDLITQMHEMSLREAAQDEDIDNRVKDEVLNASNPVFRRKTQSTKISRIIEELNHLQENDTYEKAVIVSQWTSMLEIVYKHLKRNGFKTSVITGQIPVKDRTSIVDEFNAEGRGPRVLLLSLSAGGVGLNLVGANHLFLLDMHWNPQMESQACDRIYRVGQKRPVKIHRFVVANTVEEKILELQQKKLELADNVLTGAKRSLSSKLTLQDIKALFSVT